MSDTMLDRRQFYIDGEWVDPSTTNDFDVIDPSTEQSVAVISLGSEADTDACLLYTSPSPRDS